MGFSQSISTIVSGIAAILNGTTILKNKANIFTKSTWHQLLIPNPFSLIAIPTIFTLLNALLFVISDLVLKFTNIPIILEFDMKSLILASIVGMTTSYIFFGMENLDRNAKIDIWMLMISTKIYLVFYLITLYLITFELGLASELTQVIFPIILILLIFSGIIQTLKIKLFPKEKDSFKRFYRVLLYRESLERQLKNRKEISKILTTIGELEEYNIAIYGIGKTGSSRFGIGNLPQGTLKLFSPEPFKQFLAYMDQVLEKKNLTIKKGKKTKSPEPGTEAEILENLTAVSVSLDSLVGNNDKEKNIITLSSQKRINWKDKFSAAERRTLDAMIKKVFLFEQDNDNQLSLIDVQELFEEYITAIDAKNYIRIEALNTEMNLYYDTFWKFLEEKGIRYSINDATTEFGIFNRGLSWRELDICFRNIRRLFNRGLSEYKNNGQEVFQAIRKLPGNILYKAVRQRDLLTSKEISEWYFLELSKADLDYALLNLDELIRIYLKFGSSGSNIKLELTKILFTQYLLLLKQFIPKDKKFVKILTKFVDTIEDYQRKEELKLLSARNPTIVRFKNELTFLIERERYGYELLFGLASYLKKNRSSKYDIAYNQIEEKLPSNLDEFLILYTDIRSKDWLWDWWDIEPDSGMHEITNNYEYVFLSKMIHNPNMVKNATIEEFYKYLEGRPSYFSDIYILNKLSSDDLNKYTFKDFGLQKDEDFQEAKKLIGEKFKEIVRNLEELENQRILHTEIPETTITLFFHKFLEEAEKLRKQVGSIRPILEKEFSFKVKKNVDKIQESSNSLRIRKLINKTDFIDENQQSIEELAEHFAEGFVDGETDYILKEITKDAKTLKISDIDDFINNHQDVSIFMGGSARYKVFDTLNHDLQYDSDMKNSTEWKYQTQKGLMIPVYELNTRQDVFVLISNNLKGSIIQILNKQGEQFITKLTSLDGNDTLVNEIISKKPNWLSDYKDDEEKRTYLKTMVYIEIFGRLSVENVASDFIYKVDMETL